MDSWGCMHALSRRAGIGIKMEILYIYTSGFRSLVWCGMLHEYHTRFLQSE